MPNRPSDRGGLAPSAVLGLIGTRGPIVRAEVANLSLREKVRLLTGETAWSTYALERIGLRAMVLSDGPVGVHGVTDDIADWSLLFPAPSALAATWDIQAAQTLGQLLAVEARRKGVDVVLAPVVNLQRTPVAGRHFEYYSEDPILTGNIAASLVRAIQGHGVGVCLKHFVANDSETERTSYIARMEERALREVYLAPFEQVVREASPWSIMAAYNGIEAGGVVAPATEHRYLIEDVLKGEWGYDGVVVSDWLATTSTVASALGGLDLVMPGPGGPWGDRLLAQVEAGAVPVSVIDDKVARLLRLASRVSALGSGVPLDERSLTSPEALDRDHSELITRLAAQGTVVLRNDVVDGAPALPVDPQTVRTVALIGPGAVAPFVQGGGSAHVNPRSIVLPVEGLRALLPEDAEVTVHRGGRVNRFAPALNLIARASDPVTGMPGLRVEVLDGAGQVLSTSRECADWTGRREVGPGQSAAHRVRVSTNVRLDEPGIHLLGVGTVGEYEIRIDGQLVDAGTHRAGSEVLLDSSVNDPRDVPVEISIIAPRVVELVAELQVIDADGCGRFARAAIRHAPPGLSVEEEIEAAVEAARGADLAIVVVGTNLELESEGWDRTTLAVPGHQNELVSRVASANPRTVVFVNAGAPLVLPWLDVPAPGGPAAVLWWWLPGQEAGHALAATVFGTLEPAGRLPWTLPARDEDVPVPNAIPLDGVLDYHEGVDVGYRSWLQGDLEPARPFGFGLGWGEWEYERLDVGTDAAGVVQVAVRVRNDANRPAREVVQVYIEPRPDRADGPGRRLAGHAVVDADAGESADAVIALPWRVFETWDAQHRNWIRPASEFRLSVGRNVQDLRLDSVLTIPIDRP